MALTAGSVYTKAWIAEGMLDLMDYTPEKELWKSTILEPSFGEGAFLKPIADRLFHSLDLSEWEDPFEVLKDSVRAFEVNPETFHKGYTNIYSLLLEKGCSQSLAKRLADSWLFNKDFLTSDELGDGSADYIVGNPPYIRASFISAEDKALYKRLFDTFSSGTDLYVAFFEKSLCLLKRRSGKLCFLCSDRWMQNQYGKKLRNRIVDEYHVSTVIRLHHTDVFESGVTAYPSIVLIDFLDGPFDFIDCKHNFQSSGFSQAIQFRLNLFDWIETGSFTVSRLPQPKSGMVFPLASSRKVKTVLEMKRKYPSIEETGVQIGIGLATGKDSVFLVQNDEIIEKDRLLPAFNMKLWRSRQPDKHCWIVNPWTEEGPLVKLDDFPRLKQYLESHRDELEQRFVARKNPSHWYRTIDKVNLSLLHQPKLFFPDLAKKPAPVFVDDSRYPCHDTYWLTSETWDLQVLGGLLMSRIVEDFIDVLGVKMHGDTLRFQAQYLRLIHIPDFHSLTPQIREELKSAFIHRNYDLASQAAAKAFGLEISQ